jgi:hypothetical protein
MDLDRRLCAHLKRDVAGLASWLPAHNKVVEQRLSFASWQSWGSDNQIIASVQTLLGECALALGRAKPKWTDPWASSAGSSDASDKTRSVSDRASIREELSSHISCGLLGCRCCWPGQAPSDAWGRLLIICARNECGGPARLLQRQLVDELQCDVVIGSDRGHPGPRRGYPRPRSGGIPDRLGDIPGPSGDVPPASFGAAQRTHNAHSRSKTRLDRM